MLGIIGAPYMKEEDRKQFVDRLREPLEEIKENESDDVFDAEGLAELRRRLTGR